MVCHQDPGMDINSIEQRSFMQTIYIESEVWCRNETNLPVIASLDDVLRDTWRA
jgi:hypothetical protein|tara:strand:+ start:270 stop:431 length:162 start_codon:yes stop_codon:yes gene_type:complete